MPSYDFHCKTCDKTKTIVCSIDEYRNMQDTVVCDCGETMKRRLETPGISWKTTGRTVRTGK